jgi:predicted RNA-binding protein YlxR (DUF448 family)
MRIDKVIAECGRIIAEHSKNANNQTPEQLIDAMSKLTGYGWFLAEELAKAGEAKNRAFFARKSEKMSDTSADRQSRIDVPEYGLLDRLLPQLNKVTESMRSALSYRKQEQQNSSPL